jgi:hypothetical protein
MGRHLVDIVTCDWCGQTAPGRQNLAPDLTGWYEVVDHGRPPAPYPHGLTIAIETTYYFCSWGCLYHGIDGEKMGGDGHNQDIRIRQAIIGQF